MLLQAPGSEKLTWMASRSADAQKHSCAHPSTNFPWRKFGLESTLVPHGYTRRSWKF